jgi:predicted benzoate:H+ symporter BenE
MTDIWIAYAVTFGWALIGSIAMGLGIIIAVKMFEMSTRGVDEWELIKQNNIAMAIILASGSQGGLGQAELASWLFGAFFLNGLVTIALSWRFRTPLVIFWTIPGTVLVGQALQHTPHAEVIGAFVATGLFVTALGLSGWMRRAQALLPMPIVMAMVAGVFLRFGLDLVKAVHQDPTVAGPMVLAFVLLSALPRLAERFPDVFDRSDVPPHARPTPG